MKNKKSYLARRDCSHFTGDKPCEFHKTEGALCDGCARFAPDGKKILIIKLGAMGDVIRTTHVCAGLKTKYPGCRVTWLTAPGSGELLLNIDSIDRILEVSPESLAYLMAVEFDEVLSLDPSLEAAAIAEGLRSKEKKGFGVDSSGKLYPLNDEAKEWFLTGIFDDLKKGNAKTYQQMASETAGLNTKSPEMLINLFEKEKNSAFSFLNRNNIPCDRPIIGINTGAGGRWALKRWTREGFLGLIKLINSKTEASILLFGGPLEKDRNLWLMEKAPSVLYDTGTDNSPREFMSLLNLCDLVVSGDTFAMHAAAGLGKKTAAFFGPTSAAEIELYGRGVKIVAPVECVCCYREECGKNPSCMQLITPESVYDEIRRIL